MEQKIMECCARLQTLEIRATIQNLETMLQTLYDLRDVYAEMTKEGEKDEADSE